MRLSKLPEKFHIHSGGGERQFPPPAALTPQSSFDEILAFARESGASDVHVVSRSPIVLRKFGSLISAGKDILDGGNIEAMLQDGLPADQWVQAKATGDTEFVHAISGYGRFRVTVMRQHFGWDWVARVIDQNIRSVSESGLPRCCESLTKWAQGLVLVAGPAGCGKSSTLATLVEMINQTRWDHIITIENPIEIIYEPKRCQITQRQVNLHTLSQANALRAALREDPDVMIVSELRDLESIQLAVTAAETGHLVFGTMNTNDAAQTVTSLINSFPPDEQTIIASMISESLRGVICQQLIPRVDGQSMVAAYEVLVMNVAAANMIRSGRTKQLNYAIAMGKNDGMVLLDHSLKDLVDQLLISGEEAYNRAINPSLFASYLESGGPVG
ncbi:MAG: PilT/PilU family type 4a pilus ATPase [Candidatus Omnitrophica bacterium]|nr:PilT/PilU family type 4a pilus ATPase [Candidatus Omnitrophota bacterium]